MCVCVCYFCLRLLQSILHEKHPKVDNNVLENVPQGPCRDVPWQATWQGQNHDKINVPLTVQADTTSLLSLYVCHSKMHYS